MNAVLESIILSISKYIRFKISNTKALNMIIRKKHTCKIAARRSSL